MKPQKIDGPIPGENFVADTKNYPWHRPPVEADFVKVVDRAIKNMNTPQGIGQILTALESGDTILDYVSGTARVTIGNGKIPIDVAVLAAGPIAMFVETVAEKAGIDFERGWEQEPEILTSERVKLLRGDLPEPKKEPEPEPETPVDESETEGGFMSLSGETEV